MQFRGAKVNTVGEGTVSNERMYAAWVKLQQLKLRGQQHFNGPGFSIKSLPSGDIINIAGSEYKEEETKTVLTLEEIKRQTLTNIYVAYELAEYVSGDLYSLGQYYVSSSNVLSENRFSVDTIGTGYEEADPLTNYDTTTEEENPVEGFNLADTLQGYYAPYSTYDYADFCQYDITVSTDKHEPNTAAGAKATGSANWREILFEASGVYTLGWRTAINNEGFTSTFCESTIYVRDYSIYPTEVTLEEVKAGASGYGCTALIYGTGSYIRTMANYRYLKEDEHSCILGSSQYSYVSDANVGSIANIYLEVNGVSILLFSFTRSTSQIVRLANLKIYYDDILGPVVVCGIMLIRYSADDTISEYLYSTVVIPRYGTYSTDVVSLDSQTNYSNPTVSVKGVTCLPYLKLVRGA